MQVAEWVCKNAAFKRFLMPPLLRRDRFSADPNTIKKTNDALMLDAKMMIARYTRQCAQLEVSYFNRCRSASSSLILRVGR